MFTTNKRLFCCKEASNHGSEFKILWDTFRSQIAELWFPYDRTIAIDRRWSQTIAEDRTWFAGDRRSVFPYDRRIMKWSYRHKKNIIFSFCHYVDVCYVIMWLTWTRQYQVLDTVKMIPCSLQLRKRSALHFSSGYRYRVKQIGYKSKANDH